MTQKELLIKSLKALKAQEVLKEMQNERVIVLPNDPRYTPFIGEWNGYHAPEQRFEEFVCKRRDLRRECLVDGQKKGLV